jgi:hypothetical protein
MSTRKTAQDTSPKGAAGGAERGGTGGASGLTSGLSLAEFAMRAGLIAPRLLGPATDRAEAGGAKGAGSRRSLPCGREED